MCAYSGSEARLRLEKDGVKEYSLILLDLMLPGIMGEELIEQIREASEVPILVLSAKSSLEDRVNVLELGADDYLTKPFQREEVIARINSALRRYLRFGGKETEGNLFGHTEECAVLVFENDCASLKEEDLEHIFERFYVKDQSRTSESTGLGLTINKLLAQAMGGSVRAELVEGRLRIIYTFPMISD